MNSFDCTITQMRMFLAAVDRGSFQEAAEAMYVEQSTFSRRISALESSLGYPLFDRGSRPLRLTAEGAVLAESWRSVLARLDESLAEAELLRRRRQERLFICTVDSGNAQYVMTNAARQTMERFPGLSLSLMYTPFSQWKRPLLQREIDLCLTAEFEAAALDDRFERVCILPFPKLACMLADSPLAGRKSIAVEELRDMEFIDLDESASPDHVIYVRALCRQHGFEPRFAPPVHDPHCVIAALRRPDQVYLCDQLFMGHDYPLFSSVPLEGVTSGLYAVWPKGGGSRYITEYLDRLRENLARRR